MLKQSEKDKQIREQDPLKQGLKPNVSGGKSFTSVNSRARSTKTRIETGEGKREISITQDSRARSTKTRIETFLVFFRH